MKKKLRTIKSNIVTFDDEKGLTPSQKLRQRITDAYQKKQKGGITWSDLTTIRKKIKSNRGDFTFLFVKGDSDIEKKRKSKDSQRALKPKFLSSISGNVDIELLNYANNRVNERIKKDGKQKDSLNLSFISIGTNWETRDGVESGSESGIANKANQLSFMKTIIDAIVNRSNVQIDYCPHGYEPMRCEVSPHRLRKDKQWIIFGYSSAVVDGVEQSSVFSFKLDRIQGVWKSAGKYVGDDDDEINNIYKRISRNQITYDVIPGKPALQTVVIAVKGKFNDGKSLGRVFAYHKIKEEKIHRTQTEISREDVMLMGHVDSIKNLDNSWGYFRFEVCDSARIAYRLLQYYGNLKVIAPICLQAKMRKISEELYRLYH